MVCEDHGELRRSRVSRETGLVERCKLWLTALGSHLPNGPGRAPGGDRWTARAARQGQHLPLIEAEGLIGCHKHAHRCAAMVPFELEQRKTERW